jgi:hypothetical protein
VSAGTIPVIIADGVTLPFEHLIQLDKKVVRNTIRMLHKLSSDLASYRSVAKLAS